MNNLAKGKLTACLVIVKPVIFWLWAITSQQKSTFQFEISPMWKDQCTVTYMYILNYIKLYTSNSTHNDR